MEWGNQKVNYKEIKCKKKQIYISYILEVFAVLYVYVQSQIVHHHCIDLRNVTIPIMESFSNKLLPADDNAYRQLNIGIKSNRLRTTHSYFFFSLVIKSGKLCNLCWFDALRGVAIGEVIELQRNTWRLASGINVNTLYTKNLHKHI